MHQNAMQYAPKRTVKEAVLHGKTVSFEMQNNIFLIMLLVSRFVEPPLLKSIYRAAVFRNYPQ